MLSLFQRVIVAAVEVPFEQVVAGIALVLYRTDDAAHGHTHQRQRMTGQHQ